MGVFVVGMHRSGTSAMTRLLVELGLFPGESSELMAATQDNAAGYFEVSSLTRQNDTLLAALGGSALAPPVNEGTPLADITRFEGQAAGLFDRVFKHASWVWKDPRNCLMLPFWLNAIGGSHVVVMIYRAPGEVAASLVKRDAITTAAALSLWEFYVRESLRSVRGLPVYLANYDQLLADPVAMAGELSEFLGCNAIDTSVGHDGSFGVDPGLRHQVLEPNVSLSVSQAELLGTLDTLVGGHKSFDAPEGAPMSVLSLALLEERYVAVGPAERSRHVAETTRAELEHDLEGASDELEHRQSVIDGLIAELDTRSAQVGDALTEAARWRASVDRLAAECDKRDRRQAEMEQDLEAALARIHTRAGTSG